MYGFVHQVVLRLAGGNGQPGLRDGSKRPLAVRFGAVFAVNNTVLRIVASLLSINIISRFLSGLSILVSVLLFAPAEFARFGALLAALTMASAVQFLRYESTIVSARSAAELRAAIRLTACAGAGVWLAMGLGAWIAVKSNMIGSDLAILFLLALGGRAVCRFVGRIVVRDGQFALLGRSALLLAAAQPFVVVAAFLLGANGVAAMALTDIIGNLVAGIYLIWKCRGTLRDACNVRSGDTSLPDLAREWRSLPMINLPATALAAAFVAVPLLVVLSLTDATTAGHLALAFRVLDVPAQTLASAISPIAVNRFNRNGETMERGRDPALVLWLILAVAAVFGAISITSFWLEPLVRGTQWQGLSQYLPLVALFQAGIALALPLIEVAGMRRNQRDLFIVQALAMVSVVIIALVVRDWYAALLCFGMLAAIRATCLCMPLIFRHEPKFTV